MSSDQTTNRETGGSLPDLIVVQDPDSVGAQAYRSVRETLRHAQSESPIRSILLADAGSNDHAGEAAANIGASFALNGESTVLVDLDASHPVLHAVLNTADGPGLLEWLSGIRSNEGQAPEPLSTQVDQLFVLPPGNRSNASSRASLADLLTDRACTQLIGSLGTQSRYVIFHGSVAPVSSQALTVAAQVDAVVLIVRSGTTKRTDAQRAKESLERVGANLLGVVLTDGR